MPTFDEASPAADNTAIPLPDIRGALRKKQMEEELAKIEEEEKSNKPKIDRRDKKALVKASFGVLESIHRSFYVTIIERKSNHSFFANNSCWNNSHMPMLMTHSLKKRSIQLSVRYLVSERSHSWEYRQVPFKWVILSEPL